MSRYHYDPTKLQTLRDYCSSLTFNKDLKKRLSDYVNDSISKQSGLQAKVLGLINQVLVISQVLVTSPVKKQIKKKQFYFKNQSKVNKYVDVQRQQRRNTLNQKELFKFASNSINKCIEYLKEGQLTDQCIKQILLPFKNKKTNFIERVKIFKLSITNFYFSNSAFYLNIESYLYELLSNALTLLSQNLDSEQSDDEKSIIYFQLIVIVIQNICKNDLYILTYDICKSCDKLIKKMSFQIQDSKFFDKLMLSYHYYKGFSQTNFDQDHKFQDYIICKKYFFKLLLKKYPDLNLQTCKIKIDDQDFFSYAKNQAQSLITSSQSSKTRQVFIKKTKKDINFKKQIKEVEELFFENFFLCYYFLRQIQGKSDENTMFNLLKESLLIYKLSPKFDLGVQQIQKCFPFLSQLPENDQKQLKKLCLSVIREVMKKENLIDKDQQCHKMTDYEKYIDLIEKQQQEFKESCKNSGNLEKYLQQIAEVYIYSKEPIKFLNIWRCLSILAPQKFYINYMLYLEQLRYYIVKKIDDKGKSEEKYDELVEELEKDLIDTSKDKKQFQLFWSLSCQKLMKTFYNKTLKIMPLNIERDNPIISIRKIMNNLLYEILQSQDQQEKQKIFDLVFQFNNFQFRIFKIIFRKQLEIKELKKKIQDYENDFKNQQNLNQLKENQSIIEIEIKNLQDIVIELEKNQNEEIVKTQEKKFEQNKENSNKTYILSIKEKGGSKVCVKVFDFGSIEDVAQIDAYSFIQEVAICIYLREKQHQKYLPFFQNIGYHSFNRYIHHFIQDNQIFLILEYYPINQNDILDQQGHFRFNFQDSISEINEFRSKANSLASTKSYQTDGFDQVFEQDRRVSQEFKLSEVHIVQGDSQRQRNTSVSSAISPISNGESTQDNWMSSSFSSSIQFKDQITYIPQMRQTKQKRKQRIFSKNDLFVCMLRLEQIFEILKDNKILHKDIKLLNIVWRYTDEPILIDFGIAELYQIFSYCMSNFGTISYKSYLQNKGMPINENTDLTPIIIVIYELARGQRIEEKEANNEQKAQFITKNIQRELSDIFSQDFINLIMTVVDCQLDTIKSRAKYFMWQKFEIFMNLIYDCQEINSNKVWSYQEFYVHIKKVILQIVQKRKCELKVNFDLNRLKSLNQDKTFQMLISLQSHDILKNYEGLLYLIINQQKMNHYQDYKAQIYLNCSTYLNETNFSQVKKAYSLENEHVKNALNKIFEKCLINKTKCSQSDFCNKMIDIFNQRYIILKLQQNKYEFNVNELKSQIENELISYKIEKISNEDLQLLNRIYMKLIKLHYKNEVFFELALHMEETEKSIIKFQTETSENIIEAYKRTDEIKERIEKLIKNKSTSQILGHNLSSSQNLSQELQLYQNVLASSQNNDIDVSAISTIQDASSSNQSYFSDLCTQQQLNVLIKQDDITENFLDENQATDQNNNNINLIVNMNDSTENSNEIIQIVPQNNQTSNNQIIQLSINQSQSQQSQDSLTETQTSQLIIQQTNQVQSINSQQANLNISSNQNQNENSNQSSGTLGIDLSLSNNNPSISINSASPNQSILNSIHTEERAENQQNLSNQSSSQQNQSNQNNSISNSTLGFDISSMNISQFTSPSNQRDINNNQLLQRNRLYSRIVTNLNNQPSNQNNSAQSLGGYRSSQNMSLISIQKNKEEPNISSNNSYEELFYELSQRSDSISESEKTQKHHTIEKQRLIEQSNSKKINSSQQLSIK